MIKKIRKQQMLTRMLEKKEPLYTLGGNGNQYRGSLKKKKKD
jgi:hypothetical protein